VIRIERQECRGRGGNLGGRKDVVAIGIECADDWIVETRAAASAARSEIAASVAASTSRRLLHRCGGTRLQLVFRQDAVLVGVCTIEETLKALGHLAALELPVAVAIECQERFREVVGRRGGRVFTLASATAAIEPVFAAAAPAAWAERWRELIATQSAILICIERQQRRRRRTDFGARDRAVVVRINRDDESTELPVEPAALCQTPGRSDSDGRCDEYKHPRHRHHALL
jgi:hypothetical protein